LHLLRFVFALAQSRFCNRCLSGFVFPFGDLIMACGDFVSALVFADNFHNIHSWHFPE
jgi:hypothetical protein